MSQATTTRPARCPGCGVQLPPNQAGPFHSPACRRRWVRADIRAEAAEVGALYPIPFFHQVTP
jgi:hypothetical protein